MDQDKGDNELLSPKDTIRTISKSILEINPDQLERLSYNQDTQEEFISFMETLQQITDEKLSFKHTKEDIGDVYKAADTNISFIRSSKGIWEVRPSIPKKGAMADIDQFDQMATLRFFLSREPLAGDDFIDSHETFRSPMWQFLTDTTQQGSDVITISLDNKGFAQSIQNQSENVRALLSTETKSLLEKERTEIKIADLGKVGDYWVYSGIENKN